MKKAVIAVFVFMVVVCLNVTSMAEYSGPWSFNPKNPKMGVRIQTTDNDLEYNTKKPMNWVVFTENGGEDSYPIDRILDFGTDENRGCHFEWSPDGQYVAIMRHSKKKAEPAQLSNGYWSFYPVIYRPKNRTYYELMVPKSMGGATKFSIDAMRWSSNHNVELVMSDRITGKLTTIKTVAGEWKEIETHQQSMDSQLELSSMYDKLTTLAEPLDLTEIIKTFKSLKNVDGYSNNIPETLESIRKEGGAESGAFATISRQFNSIEVRVESPNQSVCFLIYGDMHKKGIATGTTNECY